jgi:sarcosine oxidase, subunit gamma
MADIPRISVLTPLATASHPCPAAKLRPLAPAAKFIFRGRPEAVTAAGQAFVALPETACRAVTAGDRSALWLGPDEWLLIAPEGDDIVGAIADKLSGLSHALVDVGHRNVGLEIVGAEAATVLAAGCPLDLDPDAFPVGMCTRTVLGKAEIVLWRTGPDMFHIEVWRSFAAYVWRFLDEAREEFR